MIKEPIRELPCWYCKGKGSIESKPKPFGTPMIMMSVNVPCTQCKGTGKIRIPEVEQ